MPADGMRHCGTCLCVAMAAPDLPPEDYAALMEYECGWCDEPQQLPNPDCPMGRSAHPPASATAQGVDNGLRHAPTPHAKGDYPPSNYDPSNNTRSQR